jgi:hypothetical protein
MQKAVPVIPFVPDSSIFMVVDDGGAVLAV